MSGFPDPGRYADPAHSLFSAFWEKIDRGLPDPTSRHDFLLEGETMTDTSDVVKRVAITASGESPTPLDSKIVATGTYKVDNLNPGQDWFWFAALFNGASSPVEVETGAYRHRLAFSHTPDVSFPATICPVVWRDDGMGHRFLDTVVSQVEVSYGSGALTGAVVTFIPRAGDYWDDPSQTGGTGTATLPILRGVNAVNFPYGDFASDAASNIWVKVTAQTSTTVTVKIKIGDATSYGSGTQVLQRGQYNWPIKNETGARIGDRADRVELFFPAAGTIAVNDEFKFLRRRGEWTPAFVDDSTVIREVYSALVIDGEEIEITSGKITITHPSQAIQRFGRRRAARTRSRGLRECNITFGREYQDLDFRRRLALATTLSYRLSLNSKIILGTSGDLQHSIDFVAPRCKLSGPTATVQNQTTVTEALTLTAHPSSDSTYPQAVTCEIVTDIPDLTAA